MPRFAVIVLLPVWMCLAGCTSDYLGSKALGYGSAARLADPVHITGGRMRLPSDARLQLVSANDAPDAWYAAARNGIDRAAPASIGGQVFMVAVHWPGAQEAVKAGGSRQAFELQLLPAATLQEILGESAVLNVDVLDQSGQILVTRSQVAIRPVWLSGQWHDPEMLSHAFEQFAHQLLAHAP